MKRRRVISLLAMLCMIACLVFAFAACGEEHTHSYGDWTITTRPTLTEGGKASHECAEDSYKEEVDIPALSDASVWTKSEDKSEAPTHTEDGKDVYTSEYGEVEVTVPKTTEHSFGAWSITEDPTLTDGGKAERSCACGEKDTKDLPNLSDASVWTKSEEKSEAPTHTAEGKDVYTSEYGEVEVTIPKTPEHSFGAWSVTDEPTLTDGGKAERSCACGEKETKDLPNLSDATFWTKGEEVEATHETAGSVVYTNSEYSLTVTLELPAVGEHDWGEWSWKDGKEPTLTEGAKAEHTCSVGPHTETVDVPALSDTEVWTKNEEESQAPTHTKAGKGVYTSVYGEVEVTLEAEGHSYTWSITDEPTLDSTGSATGTCTCDEENNSVTETVPALNDADTWEVTDEVEADYNHAGHTTYTSKYGEVTVSEAKKVAPYDNKTYHSFTVDLNEDFSARALTIDAYTSAQLTLDANGTGIGDAFPFTVGNKIEFIMEDAATGKLRIVYTDQAEGDGEGEYTGDQKIVTAYLDFETGIILMPYTGSDFTDCYLLTPYGQYVTGAAVASVWGKSAIDYGVVCTYTYTDGDSKTFSFYIDNNDVYFNVSFTDLDGEPVAANECHQAPQFFIKSGETLLASLGFNGAEVVELDEYVGKYTVTDGDGKVLILSGYGTASYDGKEGTYKVAPDGAEYDLLVILGEVGEQTGYHVTLDGESCTMTQAVITITFNMNGNDEAAEIPAVTDHQSGVVYQLSTPENTESWVFRGWFYDANCEQPVEASFAPVEDVVVYAHWVVRIDITVHLDEDTDTALVLGEGDMLDEVLNELAVKGELNEEGTLLFDGWFYDAAFERPISNIEIEVGESMDGAEIYGKWAELPDYVGTYYGENLYGSTSQLQHYTLTISADGKISGQYTGTVTAATDKLITWEDNSGATKYFYYDKRTGTLLTSSYSSANSSAEQVITNDLAFFSKNRTDMQSFSHFAIHTPKPGDSSSSQNFYARFVVVTVKGETDTQELVLLYNTAIHSNITVKDAFGNVLSSIDDIKASKTVVVTDSEGTVILARASRQPTLDTSDDSDPLDAFYGTYTNGDETLKLDGSGNAMLGEKTGTYLVEDADGKKVGLYIEGEYFEVVLSGATFTKSKVMVQVTFSTDGKDPAVEAKSGQYNKNIEIVLDDPTNDSNVFRGWFKDSGFEQELSKNDDGKYVFTPTEAETTLYAKWLVKYTLTIHYNDESTEDLAVVYGEGETAEVERPRYSGHSFLGWFTDDTSFEQAWGTMDPESFVTSAEITADVDIYAKWGPAPIYSDTYRLYTYDSTTANGATDNGDLTKDIEIDEIGDMKAVTGASYPFAQNLAVTSYEPDTGKLVFNRVGYSSNFDAYIDTETHIIVFIARGNTVVYSDIVVLVPVSIAEGATVTGAHWDSGKVRVIDIQKSDESKIGIYLTSDVAPHFGVTFEDMSGEAIADLSNAHTALTLYVKSGDEVIARWGFDGTTMVGLDGNEGTYSHGEDGIDLGEIKLNGVHTVTIGEQEGTYSVVADQDYIEVFYDGKYYHVTLDKSAKTYVCTQPMVTITFESEHSTHEEQTVNEQIPIELPAPTHDEYVFRGWFVDANCETPVELDESGKYVPTETITLHAKWLKKVTVHVKYLKEGVEDYDLVLGEGEEAHPETPEYTEGQVFAAWHLNDQALGAESVWTDGTVVTEDITLYCEWKDAVAMFGEWVGTEVWGSTDKGGTISGGSSEKNITFDAEGKASGEKSGTVTDWDPETGTFKLGNYYGALDVKNGVLIISYTSNTVADNDYFIFVRKDISTSFGTGSSKACFWNGVGKGTVKLLEVTLSDGTTMNVLIKDGRVYGKVTFEAEPLNEGTPVTTANAYNAAKSIIIKDSDGNMIVRYVNDGTQLVESDGYDGTYTGNKGEESNLDLILNGKGGVMWGSREGSYVVDSENANLVKVTLVASGDLPAEYWEVTLNKDETSYTAEMPMVQLTLILRNEGGTETLDTQTKSVNKNIPFALAATYETYVSSAWFTDEGLQTAVELDGDGLYVPTAEATLYAKMVGKVTLTVKYTDLPNGESCNLPDGSLELPKGETPDLAQFVPEPQGSYVFGGWYENEDCTTAYTPAPLDGDKTIYCKWIEQQYKVDNSANEWTETEGTYRSTKKSENHCNVFSITFSASGTFTFNYAASYDDSYDGLYVALNNANPHQANEKVVSTSNSSGEKSVHVEAGDVLYFGAYWDYSQDSSSDYAQVSNFRFVAD